MTKRWLYQSDGELKGPIPPAELKRLVREGVIGPTTLVRREDGQKWTKAANVKGLLPSVKNEVPQASSEQSHTDRPNSFLEWYRTTRMAQLSAGSQIAVWLFCGFIWIPVLYAFSKISDGHGHRKAVKTLWIIGGAFACFMLLCAILIPIIDPEGWKNIREGNRRDGSPRHRSSAVSHGDTAEISHDPATRIAMPSLPADRLSQITYSELEAIIDGQPKQVVPVRRVEGIDFTSGLNGEPIKRFFFGTLSDWKRGEVGDGYFYVDSNTGKAVLHGAQTFYNADGFPREELLNIHGVLKSRCYTRDDGRYERREVYRGDSDHAVFNYFYFNGGELSQFGVLVGKHYRDADGSEAFSTYKHGYQVIMTPEGALLNERMFREGSEVGLRAWEDGRIALEQGDPIEQSAPAEIQKNRHPAWRPVQRTASVSNATTKENVVDSEEQMVQLMAEVALAKSAGLENMLDDDLQKNVSRWIQGWRDTTPELFETRMRSAAKELGAGDNPTTSHLLTVDPSSSKETVVQGTPTLISAYGPWSANVTVYFVKKDGQYRLFRADVGDRQWSPVGPLSR